MLNRVLKTPHPCAKKVSSAITYSLYLVSHLKIKLSLSARLRL